MKPIDYSDVTVIAIPDYKWRLRLAPKLYYESETAPCWFHRVMLKLVLGFTWRRLDTTKETI